MTASNVDDVEEGCQLLGSGRDLAEGKFQLASEAVRAVTLLAPLKGEVEMRSGLWSC